ncbi:MAG: aldo/keto reductase [Eubacteriales bacterium]|nr:aldo/keto reductase [Eubacteriales bacterium]
MKYKQIETLQGTLEISGLVIGSAVKMQMLSERELFELFDIYLDAGGNCIDTARAYGGGQAEELIGRYMKKRENRNHILISTKCGHPAPDGKSRLTGRDMQEDLESSLKALGTDHIDIYWLHKDDESYPAEAVIDDINVLIQSGKVGAVGCSNWHVDRIAAANTYAQKSGQQGFCMSQIQWNLAATKEEYFRQFTTVVMDQRSYDWYYEQKMPVFAFSPQAQGFFSKMAGGGAASLNAMLSKCYLSPDNLKRLEKVKKLSQERHVPVSVPVLAYLINNKLPCFPVFGATTKEMLYETLTAADFEMTAEEADRLFAV